MGFKDQLTGRIPEDHLTHLTHLTDHYDVIGSVAILPIPKILEDYKYDIAEALLSHRRSIKTVLNKTGAVSGNSRTARYEILAGRETVTTCHEYGFSYTLDVLTSFFNPNLSTERSRVTGQILRGERVLVPFSGVGPFVVPAAARGAHVVAIEQNPDAFRWLLENTRKNGVDNRVTAIWGNAFDTSLLPATPFDRVIIPTPYGMDAILDVLKPYVKPGGRIHIYTFRNKGQISELKTVFSRNGYEITRVRVCGNVAPSVARWVFDLKTGS